MDGEIQPLSPKPPTKIKETLVPSSKDLGFRGLGFRGFGFRVQGFRGLGVQGLGFRGSGFRGFGFRGFWAFGPFNVIGLGHVLNLCAPRGHNT